MKTKILLFGAALLLLQACAVGPTYTPLSDEHRAKINSVDTYNLVIQDEIKPAVHNSNTTGAMGGGLLFAAIDSGVNKGRHATAHDIIEPLHNVTLDFDYRQLLGAELTKQMSLQLPVADLNEAGEAILIANVEVNEKVKKLNKGEAFFYTSSFYSFKDEFKSLVTETIVFLFGNGEDTGIEASSGAYLTKPIYFNRFTFISDSIGEGGESSIEQWAAENGKLYRQTLQESISKTAENIVYDLSLKGLESCKKPVSYSNYVGAFPNKINTKGYFVNVQGDNRITVRNSKSSALESVPSDYSPTNTNSICAK